MRLPHYSFSCTMHRCGNCTDELCEHAHHEVDALRAELKLARIRKDRECFCGYDHNGGQGESLYDVAMPFTPSAKAARLMYGGA